MVMSKVKNMELAKEGKQELEWARRNMPVLENIRKQFEKEKPLVDLKIGTALHLEKKTGLLLETLKAGGAEVFAASCNPLTTDDKVAAALADEINVYAWAGQNDEEYYWCLNQVLDGKPDIVIDDGCDLIFAIHTKRKELLDTIIGGCEETTTGIIRLNAMENDGELKFPVFAVNNAYSKYLFDNLYGTAASTTAAIMNITNKLISGKTVVVVGYGWCGRGIADKMKGMGANVIVVEIAGTLGPHESGYHRALSALYSGFRVMSMKDAAPLGDIFITATGDKHVIDKQHIEKMKGGAILCNAGHFDNEINIPALEKMAKEKSEMKSNIDEYELEDGRKLYLLSEGRLVNLARPGGQGHPIEIMDGSFGVQALCVRELAVNGKKLDAKVQDVPKEVDDRVAELALLSHGVELEPPTEEQKKYSVSWKEGT